MLAIRSLVLMRSVRSNITARAANESLVGIFVQFHDLDEGNTIKV